MMLLKSTDLSSSARLYFNAHLFHRKFHDKKNVFHKKSYSKKVFSLHLFGDLRKMISFLLEGRIVFLQFKLVVFIP